MWSRNMERFSIPGPCYTKLNGLSNETSHIAVSKLVL